VFGVSRSRNEIQPALLCSNKTVKSDGIARFLVGLRLIGEVQRMLTMSVHTCSLRLFNKAT